MYWPAAGSAYLRHPLCCTALHASQLAGGRPRSCAVAVAAFGPPAALATRCPLCPRPQPQARDGPQHLDQVAGRGAILQECSRTRGIGLMSVNMYASPAVSQLCAWHKLAYGTPQSRQRGLTLGDKQAYDASAEPPTLLMRFDAWPLCG